MCRYGLKCYRKNPAHFSEWDHPADHPFLSAAAEPDSRCVEPAAAEASTTTCIAAGAQKRGRPEPTDAFDIDEAEARALCEFDIDAAVATSREPAACAIADADAAPPRQSAAEGGCGAALGAEPSGEAAASTGEVYEGKELSRWQARIRQLFLVPFGADVFALFDLARRIRPSMPLDAFASAGVRLLAPFAFLSGRGGLGPLSDRGAHDPPEFQPLLSYGDGAASALETHVLGFWRDEPEEEEALLVLRKPLAAKERAGQPGVCFSVVGETLWGAVHAQLAREAKAATLLAAEARRLSAELKKSAEAGGQSLEAAGASSAASKARRKRVPKGGKTSNGMGVIVPYDARSEVGFRQLHISGIELRKLLSRIAASPPAECAQQQAELDELINWANIANDESDFGASLQLGQDLLNCSTRFAAPAAQMLGTAYELLGRHPFASIARMHAVQRKAAR